MITQKYETQRSGVDYGVRLARSWVTEGYNVWISRVSHGSSTLKIEYLQKDGSWLECKDSGMLPPSSFDWPVAILKAFGLALGEAGIVHQDLVFNSKELQATKYHLEDMRKLAFKDTI